MKSIYYQQNDLHKTMMFYIRWINVICHKAVSNYNTTILNTAVHHSHTMTDLGVWKI